MSMPVPFPAQVDFHGDRHITRWRPLVQWLLAIPQLLVASALRSLRQVLILISLFTVLFTERIPRALFDMITTTYRYEWRAISYALFMHEDYPPFDFQPAAADDGVEPHTALSISYPEHLDRWKPLYKWFVAVPHYLVLAVLAIAAVFAILAGLVGVISLTESRANALIGVFISVTTIPAAADVGVSLAFSSWHEAWGSTLQLLLNIALLIVVGAAGLATQRLIWRRRTGPAP